MFAAGVTKKTIPAPASLLLFWRNKFKDNAVGDFGDWQRARIPPATHKYRFQLTVFLAQFEP